MATREGGAAVSLWGRLVNHPLYAAFQRVALATPLRRFWLLAAIPLAWMLLMHLGPLVAMLRISLLDAYPLTQGQAPEVTLAHYASFFQERIYLQPFLRTLVFATLVTAATLVIVFPIAYYIAKVVPASRQIRLLLLLLVPFWVSYIIRTFAVMVVLGNRGAFNIALRELGFIDLPIPFMYTYFSLAFGVLYLTVLYMLLPLYAAIEKIDDRVLQAAADLGAGPLTRFRRIVLPLSKEGIASGCTLVFLLSTGYYAVPLLLGGPETTLFAETIGNFFSVAGDRWPTGAAFAVIMLTTALAAVGVFLRLLGRGGARIV
jgi:spermidine/putrescine transport system permease protein